MKIIIKLLVNHNFQTMFSKTTGDYILDFASKFYQTQCLFCIWMVWGSIFCDSDFLPAEGADGSKFLLIFRLTGSQILPSLQLHEKKCMHTHKSVITMSFCGETTVSKIKSKEALRGHLCIYNLWFLNSDGQRIWRKFKWNQKLTSWLSGSLCTALSKNRTAPGMSPASILFTPSDKGSGWDK